MAFAGAVTRRHLLPSKISGVAGPAVPSDGGVGRRLQCLTPVKDTAITSPTFPPVAADNSVPWHREPNTGPGLGDIACLANPAIALHHGVPGDTVAFAGIVLGQPVAGMAGNLVIRNIAIGRGPQRHAFVTLAVIGRIAFPAIPANKGIARRNDAGAAACPIGGVAGNAAPAIRRVDRRGGITAAPADVMLPDTVDELGAELGAELVAGLAPEAPLVWACVGRAMTRPRIIIAKRWAEKAVNTPPAGCMPRPPDRPEDGPFADASKALS